MRSKWLWNVGGGAVLAAVALAGAGCGALPESAVAAMEGADTFEVMTLDPHAGERPSEAVGGVVADTFRGHGVTWRATVTDAGARERIVGIVNGGISKSATQAKCFNPRHAIHSVKGGRVVDVLICYECSNVLVVEGSVDSPMLGTDNVQGELDAELKKLGAKVAE